MSERVAVVTVAIALTLLAVLGYVDMGPIGIVVLPLASLVGTAIGIGLIEVFGR